MRATRNLQHHLPAPGRAGSDVDDLLGRVAQYECTGPRAAAEVAVWRQIVDKAIPDSVLVDGVDGDADGDVESA